MVYDPVTRIIKIRSDVEFDERWRYNFCNTQQQLLDQIAKDDALTQHTFDARPYLPPGYKNKPSTAPPATTATDQGGPTEQVSEQGGQSAIRAGNIHPHRHRQSQTPTVSQTNLFVPSTPPTVSQTNLFVPNKQLTVSAHGNPCHGVTTNFSLTRKIYMHLMQTINFNQKSTQLQPKHRQTQSILLIWHVAQAALHVPNCAHPTHTSYALTRNVTNLKLTRQFANISLMTNGRASRMSTWICPT
jgi:hypothetical protein